MLAARLTASAHCIGAPISCLHILSVHGSPCAPLMQPFVVVFTRAREGVESNVSETERSRGPRPGY